MDRYYVDEDKVANFMAIAEWDNREVAIQILEKCNWDEVKSSSYIYDNLSECCIQSIVFFNNSDKKETSFLMYYLKNKKILIKF